MTDLERMECNWALLKAGILTMTISALCNLISVACLILVWVEQSAWYGIGLVAAWLIERLMSRLHRQFEEARPK